MHEDLCSEFMYHMDKGGALEIGNPPIHIQNWLDDLNLPDDLRRLARHTWPQVDCSLADIRFFSSQTIYDDENTPLLLKYQFLHVGYGLNGDFFVIDFSNELCVPGFIALGEWDHQADMPESPHKFFAPAAPNFDVFLYRVAEGKYVPGDYYAAWQFNDFLAREGIAEHRAAGDGNEPSNET